MAFQFLQKQSYRNFEVIVSDNFTNEELSCSFLKEKEYGFNLKYVRPTTHLSMVENWNFAYQFCEGEYVAFFTDKMFLMPGLLDRLVRLIVSDSPDIINWQDAPFVPDKFPEYFASGKLFAVAEQEVQPIKYDPRKALELKLAMKHPRSEMNPVDYARGKICFGVFSKKLCERIVKISGSIFHPLSPDYTSMILGLYHAETCYDLVRPGIIHISTDLSNGGNANRSEISAFNYLKTCGDINQILSNLPVAGVYASISNCVLYDYVNMAKKYNLNLNFEIENWLVFIEEEIRDKNKIWSNDQVCKSHIKMFDQHIENLQASKKKRYKELSKIRQEDLKDRSFLKYKKHAKDFISSFIPDFLKKKLKRKRLKVARNYIEVASLLEILKKW